MTQDPKILYFKRLNLADLSFKRAEALAIHMRDTKPKPTESLYSPMIAGVVVTYMVPFVRADGLGGLSSDFTDFPDQDLIDMHTQLEESRHKLYAHRDLLVASTLPTDNGQIPFEMQITFEDPNKGYTLAHGAIELSPLNLKEIIRLCQHQQKKITSKIRPLMRKLTEGKDYAPGTYTLGLDFP